MTCIKRGNAQHFSNTLTFKPTLTSAVQCYLSLSLYFCRFYVSDVAQKRLIIT